jgi:threonyl-tRNA synthetase
MQRAPYLLIVGDKEVEAETVTLRTQSGNDLGHFSVSEVVDKLVDEVSRRAAIA